MACSVAGVRRLKARLKASCLGDRKSTRLNSSHLGISYAVFCLKKKKKSYGAHRLLHLPRLPPRRWSLTPATRGAGQASVRDGAATSAHIGDSVSIFFFNDTATTEIYTLSLHDALPI